MDFVCVVDEIVCGGVELFVVVFFLYVWLLIL